MSHFPPSFKSRVNIGYVRLLLTKHPPQKISSSDSNTWWVNPHGYQVSSYSCDSSFVTVRFSDCPLQWHMRHCSLLGVAVRPPYPSRSSVFGFSRHCLAQKFRLRLLASCLCRSYSLKSASRECPSSTLNKARYWSDHAMGPTCCARRQSLAT